MANLFCPRCGGGLNQNNTTFTCSCCGKQFEKDTLEQEMADFTPAWEETKPLSRYLDAFAQQRRTKPRIAEEYEALEGQGEPIPLPDTFRVAFYQTVSTADRYDICTFIARIDAAKETSDMPEVIDFLLNYFSSYWQLPLKRLIEEACLNGEQGELYTSFMSRYERAVERANADTHRPKKLQKNIKGASQRSQPADEALKMASVVAQDILRSMRKAALEAQASAPPSPPPAPEGQGEIATDLPTESDQGEPKTE